MRARQFGGLDVPMHLGHANGFVTAPPDNDPVIERDIRGASSVLPYFKA